MPGRSLWSMLKEPKFISAMVATSYSVAVIAGLILLFATPEDLVRSNMSPLSWLIGGCFLGGGALGTVSLHGGDWWLERACIYALVIATTGMIFAIWGFESGAAEKALWTMMMLFILAHLAVRFYRIRGLTLDPMK